MKVRIETATVWEKKRREAGSVIDVPSEVFEKNSGWMKPTDEPVSDAPAPKAAKASDGDK